MKSRSMKVIFARIRLLCLALLAVPLHVPAFAQSKTQTRLLISAELAKPGETVWAGLELKMPPHWHTYWRYQGDAGLPSAVAWSLPAGVSAGEIQWPLPKKNLLTAGDISFCTYIYEDRVVLLVPIKLEASLPSGPLKLSAALTWLECEDQGVCVPRKSVLNGNLAVGVASKPSVDGVLLEQWRARLPRTGAPAHATAQWEKMAPGNTRTVIIYWESADKQADFYPYEHQPSDVEGPTVSLPAPPGHLRLRKTLKKNEGEWPEKLAGILVGNSDSSNPTALEADLPLLAPTPGSGEK